MPECPISLCLRLSSDGQLCPSVQYAASVSSKCTGTCNDLSRSLAHAYVSHVTASNVLQSNGLGTLAFQSGAELHRLQHLTETRQVVPQHGDERIR